MSKQHNIENYRIAKFTKDIPFSDQTGGKIYCKSDGAGAILSTRAIAEIELNWGNQIIASVEPLMTRYRSYDGQDLTDKSLLIIREGGIGDLLFTTPAIKYLYTKYECDIGVSCSSRYKQVFEANPYISTIYGMPLLVDDFEKYNYHISFQGLIEENSEYAKVMNAYDLYIKQFGLEDSIPDKDKIPTLIIDPKAIRHVELNEEKIFGEGFKDKIRIFIHYSTSSKVRTYPGPRWFEMAQEILKIDDRVCIYVIDSQRRASEIDSFIKFNNIDQNRIVNLANHSLNLNIAFTLASYADLMIGADSSMLHIAGAFGIPLIGIYGPFPSEHRIKYYKNAIGLDLRTKCSPCRLHTGDVACPYGDPSPCLCLLEYSEVVKYSKHLLKDKLGLNNAKVDRLAQLVEENDG